MLRTTYTRTIKTSPAVRQLATSSVQLKQGPATTDKGQKKTAEPHATSKLKDLLFGGGSKEGLDPQSKAARDSIDAKRKHEANQKSGSVYGQQPTGRETKRSPGPVIGMEDQVGQRKK
ncbi:hypothetical protein BZG36_03517 [Bifiguratus adelaidae]|uniref:Uncharacterized protein n=1 Tax=Bifiguratus adelaidae TaxID=1938954 RepID=A0A261XY66_9FUNG|nr:hypothetical protein BZG36_03517 [Bifiguratus adelaidae]